MIIEASADDFDDNSQSLSPVRSLEPVSGHFVIQKEHLKNNSLGRALEDKVSGEGGNAKPNQDIQKEEADNDSILNFDDDDQSDNEQNSAEEQGQVAAEQNTRSSISKRESAENSTNVERNEAGGLQNSSLTEGLNQMSAEELKQLKILMGRNLKGLMRPEPEEALPFSSSYHYENEDDYMKRKLKNMKKREETRK